MTLKEKAYRISQYCDTHGCSGCPLLNRPLCHSYAEGDEKGEKIVAENYEILFGKATDPVAEPVNITLHAAVCDELKDLYRRKNTDYGDSFHKTYLEEGLAMSRIRLTDKLERFKRLTRSGEQNVKDESVRDTLIDLANYAIMTIVEMEREKR